jgi:hypothetical protein
MITTPGTHINHIGIPFSKSNLINADSLVKDIPGGTTVYYWSAGAQATIGHAKGLPFNNFSVKPGYPYYVNVTCDSMWPAASPGSNSIALAEVAKKDLNKSAKSLIALSQNKSSVRLTISTTTSSTSLSGGVPHMVCGTYKGRISHGLIMRVWVTSRMDEVLTESIVGIGCDSIYWWVNVGTFPTPWKAGEKLEVELEDSTNKLGGLGSITLTNEGADIADVINVDKPVRNLGIDMNGNDFPKVYSLVGNYPNPFNPTTTIVYRLPERAEVTLAVFDIIGRLVKVIFTGTQNEGEYSQSWDGIDNNGLKVSSGVYFYKMKTDSYMYAKKMMLLK